MLKKIAELVKIGAEETNQKPMEKQSGLLQPSQQPIVNCVAGKLTIINNNDTSKLKLKKEKQVSQLWNYH